MFIRNRRRNTLITGCIGASIVLIPMSIIVCVITMKSIKMKKSLDYIHEQQARRVRTTICIANTDIDKGEKLELKDIRTTYIVSDDELDFSSEKMLQGKVANQAIKKDQVIASGMIHDDRGFDDDTRLHYFKGININPGIIVGSIIDIRIVFPDGEDYIVTEHKKVQSMDENGIQMYVSEEEILKLASALVDVKEYDGTSLYAILYAADYQESAVSDYPANSKVCQLGDWNPNMIERVFTEFVIQKRDCLESNLINQEN